MQPCTVYFRRTWWGRRIKITRCSVPGLMPLVRLVAGRYLSISQAMDMKNGAMVQFRLQQETK